MEIGVFEWYLIGINILGFILFGINNFLYARNAEQTIDTALTIVSILGGSVGIFLFTILFDRKAVKENMMSRVFLVSIMIIQIVAYLFFRGFRATTITFAFLEFFDAHPLLVTYLLAINVITLIAFGLDKIKAVEGRNRIRILTLLGLAFVGGSIGALIGMYAFRHKTRMDYFTVGVPLILVMQVVVIFYLMNL